MEEFIITRERKNAATLAFVVRGGSVLAATLFLAACAVQEATQAQLARSFFPAADAATEIRAEQTGNMRIWEIWSGPEVIGYIGEKTVPTRSGTLRMRVVLDSAFTVERAEVLEYVGARGGEVRSAAFTRQFHGKRPIDPIEIGKDIDAVTGATISSNAMAEGLKSILRAAQQAAHPS